MGLEQKYIESGELEAEEDFIESLLIYFEHKDRDPIFQKLCDLLSEKAQATFAGITRHFVTVHHGDSDIFLRCYYKKQDGMIALLIDIEPISVDTYLDAFNEGLAL
jgi:hypothetical protein